MQTSLRVLLIEDSVEDADELISFLRGGHFDLTLRRVVSAEEMERALDQETWDVVIADYELEQFDALSALKILKQTQKDIPFIIVSGNVGEDLAVDAMHAGAHDYIMKGSLARLIPAIRRELREVDERTARKRAEKMIQHLAYHDILTGLLNRREFEIRVTQALNEARRGNQQHALVYIDLDQFKLVNDTCGHIAGDELLKQLTRLLETKIPEDAVLSRLGGDEFGVLLKNVTVEQAYAFAEEVLRAIRSFRFDWRDSSFEVAASIGVVGITKDSSSLSSLLSTADVACYAAKDLGRNRIHIYSELDADLARRHSEMQQASQIAQAMEDRRFRLFRQEIHAIRHEEPVSHCELLIRMEDREGNLVAPKSFIPAAERYNFMPTLDRWVLNCLMRYVEMESPDYTLYAVNISGTSLNDDGFLEYVKNLLARYEFPAKRLCFEITETAAITNLNTATDFIAELKRLGCRFALDDFGSGLSSFTYLKTLPVDFLKIDGYFIKDITDDPIDAAMVESINQIGHVMGMETIAEFVENEEILARLQQIGIDFAQGYGVHRPEPLTDNMEVYQFNLRDIHT